jgi:hypothetical protein
MQKDHRRPVPGNLVSKRHHPIIADTLNLQSQPGTRTGMAIRTTLLVDHDDRFIRPEAQHIFDV